MKLQVSLNPSWTRELTPGDRRLWLLRAIALRIEIRADPLWVVEVFWKRLVVAGFALLLAVYLAAATVAWWWWDRIPGNQVRWKDVVLAPVRWDELTRRRGETAIATALERLKQKDYAEAYYGLRVGLARAPGNARARVVLAGMLAGQSPLQAITLLEEGLPYTPNDQDLLRALFGLYASQEARGRARQQAELLMAPGRSSAVSASTRFLVGVIRCGLLLDQEELAEADRAHTELEPLITNEVDRKTWARLRTDLMLKRQQVAEAQAWYRQRIQGKDEGPEALRLAAEIALAAGDMEELSLSLRRLQLSGDDSVSAQLYAYRCWHRAKQPARRLEAERKFILLHGDDDAALQSLAALAVTMGQADTVNRAMQAALAHRLSDFAFKVDLTELALREGRFGDALQLLPDWEPAIETLRTDQRFYPQFISRLARCTTPGGAQQTDLLLHTLAAAYGQARMGVYRLAAEVLERSGNVVAAAQAASAGLVLYPYSEPLLAAQERLQGLVSKQTARLAEAAKVATTPVPATDAEALAALTVDAPSALAALDQALAQRDLAKADRLLRQLHDRPPAWWEGSATEIAVREVPLRLALDQQPLALESFKGLVIRAGAARSAAFKLVRDLAARGEKEQALLLARETVRLQPDDPAAAKLLREVESASP